jgi:hypothetical protein
MGMRRKEALRSVMVKSLDWTACQHADNNELGGLYCAGEQERVP